MVASSHWFCSQYSCLCSLTTCRVSLTRIGLLPQGIGWTWTSSSLACSAKTVARSALPPIINKDDLNTKRKVPETTVYGIAASGNHFLSSSSDISDDVASETKRLVETAMLAAATGLAYFLSNSFRVENYFGCFFPLPLVISSLRWGSAASRKTMVATATLLLVLSGPIKAVSYLLMHGFLGLTMGMLWRSRVTWGVSLLFCTLVRSLGAMGFLFLSSWLLRDNLLVLIAMNAHASISFMLAAMGINAVPSMGSIYFIFGTLVLLNCGSFVFLLHVLYAIFLRRLGVSPSVGFPAWLKAL